MPNRYCNLLGSKKISEDFANINVGFDRVQAETDADRAILINQQAQITTEQLARIAADNAHLQSLTAHAASAITLAVAGLSSGDVNAGLAELMALYNNIISSQVEGKDSEVVDARTGADSVARATVGALIREIHAKLLAAATATAILRYGMNYVLTSDVSPLALTVKGRTLVNLLGKDGNCEDLSKFTTYQATLELEPDTKVYGNNSIVIKTTTTAVGIMLRPFTALAGKFYIALADLKTSTLSGGLMLGFNAANYGAVVNSGNWNTAYTKFTVGSETSNHLEIVAIGTAADTFGYVDGIRLYEIPASIYAKIDVDPEYTGDKLAAKYPNVDGVQHLDGFWAKSAGKNLLPPFTEWDLHANATVISPYDLQHSHGSGAELNASPKISVIGGTTVSLSGAKTGIVILRWFDKELIMISESYTLPAIVTLPLNARYVDVVFYVSSAGVFTFTNPQLELGSVASEFTPFNEDYLYIPTKLAGDEISGVYDTYDTDSQTVTRRWKTDVSLDGFLGWAFAAVDDGFKNIQHSPLSDALGTAILGDRTSIIARYDGKVISNGNPTLYPDVHFIHGGSKVLSISIADTDSGWTESLNPSNAACNALMNGWKANGNDGTAYNSWVSVLDGSAPATNTIEWVSANKAPNWNGWGSLSYQLAETESEVIVSEGSLALVSGGNQVEIGSGHGKPNSEKYAVTTNPVDVVGQYKTSQKSIQDELVKKQADIATQVSINVNAIAELYKRTNALGG